MKYQVLEEKDRKGSFMEVRIWSI